MAKLVRSTAQLADVCFGWKADARQTFCGTHPEFTRCHSRVPADSAGAMWLALLSALFVVYRTEAPSPTEQGLGAAYQSTKSLAALRTCLTDKLADVGEVVAVKL